MSSDAGGQVEEIEHVLALSSQLPVLLKEDYAQLLLTLPQQDRLATLRYLHSLAFDPAVCKTLLQVANRLSSTSIGALVPVLESYGDDSDLLRFLSSLTDVNLVLFVSQANTEEGRVIQTLHRYLSLAERSTLADNINSLSLPEFSSLLHDLQLNKRNKCSLCRSKRLLTLETHLLHDEVPAAILPVPGTISLYSNAYESWSNPDSSELRVKYIIDGEKIVDVSVCYHSSTIDFTVICDNCLRYVYESVCTQGRHVEIFHLAPEQRSVVQQSLRKDEQLLPFLLEKLSRERLKRRAREFCQKSLLQMQKGIRRDTEERVAKQREIAQNTEEELVRLKRADLIENSRKTVGNWNVNHEQFLASKLNKRMTLAALNYHNSFGDEDGNIHRSIEREHPLSWRLAQFEQQGHISTPLTAKAASATFGLSKIHPDVRLGELRQWKDSMVTAMIKFEADEAERNHKARQDEIDRHAAYVEYVDERLQSLDRKAHRKKMNGLIEEERRLAQRHRDKAHRRAARLRATEMKETELMILEDRRSHSMRSYLLERIRESCELTEMRKQETIQCLVDKFWGIDLAERLRREEAERKRRAYEELVEEYRVLCVQTKIIQSNNSLLDGKR